MVRLGRRRRDLRRSGHRTLAISMNRLSADFTTAAQISALLIG
jgi:hypothetical protein